MRKPFQTTLSSGLWISLIVLILGISICGCSKQSSQSNATTETATSDSEQPSDHDAIFDFAEGETADGENGTIAEGDAASGETADGENDISAEGNAVSDETADSGTVNPEGSQSAQKTKEITKLPEEKAKTSKEPETKKPVAQPESLHRVVVASFETQSNAEKMLKVMLDEGYPAYLKVTEENGKSAYYVQVGAFETLSNAQALVDELSKKGYKASIVHFK